MIKNARGSAGKGAAPFYVDRGGFSGKGKN